MPQSGAKGEGGRRKAEIRAFLRSPLAVAFVSPFRFPPSLFACLLAGCLSLAAAARAQAPAPTALPAALERPEASRPEQRAELQRELEHQGHLLEAQSAVLKIVAKLVGPAVVHIETDVPPESNSAYNHARHVEEAGSGVIIELKGNYYVLTNRHVVRGAAPAAIRINLADGRRIHPTKVLEDPATDVAVLAVSAPDLTAAPVGRQRSDADWRLRAGGGQPLRAEPFGHVWNHQRQRPPQARPGRRQHDPLSGFPANRRGHQSRQQRRPLGESPRRGDRHQHGHRQRHGRQRGRRFLHSRQHVHDRGAAVDRHGHGDAGLSWA